MRIFITGISGTIGRPLHAALLEQGHEVYGCDRSHSDNPNVVRADIANFRQLETAIRARHPDLVYHLAAEFGRKNGEEFYEQVWQTNAIGTKNLITLQRQLGFKMIHASSSEVYGEMRLPEGELMAETLTDTRGFQPSNDYAVSKWANELQIRNSWAEWNAPTMVLRFFNAYGPGEHYTPYRSVVCLFCYKALRGEPWDVFPNYHRVFMFVEEFVATLVRAVTRFHPGQTINVGGTEYRSVQELSDLVIRLTGASPGLAMLKPWDGLNTVNKRPDITKARMLLGHDPKVTLEEGVPKTLEWMRKVYNIDDSRSRIESFGYVGALQFQVAKGARTGHQGASS